MRVENPMAPTRSQSNASLICLTESSFKRLRKWWRTNARVLGDCTTRGEAEKRGEGKAAVSGTFVTFRSS